MSGIAIGGWIFLLLMGLLAILGMRALPRNAGVRLGSSRGLFQVP